MRSSSHTHKRARSLRRTLTPPEAMLWIRLRERGEDLPIFRRQHPIGPFIADFYCSGARLVVEIDGAGHDHIARAEHDERRNAFMEARGYCVMRILAADVMRDADQTATAIFDAARGLILQRK